MKTPSQRAKLDQVRASLPPDIDSRLGSQAIDSMTGERVVIDTVRKSSPERIDVVDSHGVSHERVSPWRFRILK